MTTWAEIDLTAIRNNARKFRTLSSTAKLIAVVKANAYGHGVIPVAQSIDELVSIFAVATIEEAIELRSAQIEKPILLLFDPLPDLSDEILHYRLTPVVSNPELCLALSKSATKFDRAVPVHVNVNTGMNRDGISPSSAIDFIRWLRTLSGIEPEGIMTHFATAEAVDRRYFDQQLNRFKAVISGLGKCNLLPPIVHVANSAAALTTPESHFSALRIGLGLYGIDPLMAEKNPVELEPALTWKAKVIGVRSVEAGESVSYGSTFTAKRRTKLATLRAGYADGYPLSLSNRGVALIGGERCNLVGAVCMDVSIFEVPPSIEVNVGDEAILIGSAGGPSSISANEVARWAGTISYEILTRIGSRVPRTYE